MLIVLKCFICFIETCDLNTSQALSPLNRSFVTAINKESPPTPRTKLLDNWNLDNRNLKVTSECDSEFFLKLISTSIRLGSAGNRAL